MSQVATHIAEALDLDLLMEVLYRKLRLEADRARETSEELGEVRGVEEAGEE